jgi:thymidine phosphorylase
MLASHASECVPDRGFAPLPGTTQEAEAIPPLLNSAQKPLQQAQATESAVRAVRSPKILHLATHGFFLENEEIFLPTTLSIPDSDPPVPIEMNPMVRSGLALAGANHAQEITRGDDGLLTALEVTSMDLRGTDLVVLSACETGRGKVQVGEGVYGLRRALVLAGRLLEMGEAAERGKGVTLARAILEDGRAWKKFQAIAAAQGGMREVPAPGAEKHVAEAADRGTVSAIDNRVLARVAKLAGAPEAPTAGIDLHAHVGALVARGAPLFTVHAETPGELAYAVDYLHRQPSVITVVPA